MHSIYTKILKILLTQKKHMKTTNLYQFKIKDPSNIKI